MKLNGPGRHKSEFVAMGEACKTASGHTPDPKERPADGGGPSVVTGKRKRRSPRRNSRPEVIKPTGSFILDI